LIWINAVCRARTYIVGIAWEYERIGAGSERGQPLPFCSVTASSVLRRPSPPRTR